jgi:hypothetical protein
MGEVKVKRKKEKGKSEGAAVSTQPSAFSQTDLPQSHRGHRGKQNRMTTEARREQRSALSSQHSAKTDLPQSHRGHKRKTEQNHHGGTEKELKREEQVAIPART